MLLTAEEYIVFNNQLKDIAKIINHPSNDDVTKMALFLKFRKTVDLMPFSNKKILAENFCSELLTQNIKTHIIIQSYIDDLLNTI